MRPQDMSQARVTSHNLHKQQLPMATTRFDASMVCPAAHGTEQGSEYECSDAARSRTRPACRLFRTPLLRTYTMKSRCPPTQWAAENTQPCAHKTCPKLESLPLTCSSNNFPWLLSVLMHPWFALPLIARNRGQNMNAATQQGAELDLPAVCLGRHC